MDADDLIRTAIDNALRDHADMIEAMCERMLTDPRGWGVLEHDYGLRFTVELSPLVPFGAIHIHQATEGQP